MHHVTIAAISALCLTQISASPALELTGTATYLHPSLHGNRSGCGGHYSRYDPTYLAAPPARYAAWPCGTSLVIEGPHGTAHVTRQDSCPRCGPNHVDLGEAAFLQVCGPLSRGVCPITIERYEE